MEAENVELLEDPVLRHLMRFWIPQVFLALPWDEQRWRGRLFLMALTVTGGVPFSWAIALDRDPDSVADARRLVAETPDEAIIEGLAALAAG